MTETRGTGREFRREIELIDLIEVLLRRKKLIIGGVLVCVLATGLFSLLQPRSYQAESLVVVSPAIISVEKGQQRPDEQGEFPQPGTEIMIPSLAAQTYEVLAKSDELMYALADTLIKSLEPGLLEKLTDADISVERLGFSLSQDLEVELIKETEKAKSPLLVFRYASTEPQIPVKVVNLWIELFLQRNRGLSSNVTDEFYKRVQVQYKSAKDNLEEGEKRLHQVEAGYHELNIVNTEMAFKNTKLDSVLKTFKRLQTEQEDKQRQLSHLDRLLTSLEEDGEWIGYLPSDQVTALGRSGNGASSMRVDLIRLVGTIRQLEQDSITVWQVHERRMQGFEADIEVRILAFERDKRIDRKRKYWAYLASALATYRGEIAAIDQNLEDVNIQLQVRKENLDELPEVLVTSKAVTDDALWNQVSRDGEVSPGVQEKLGKYRLQTEVLNPVYQNLAAEVNDLQIRWDILLRRKTHLESEIPQLQVQLLSVRGELDSLEVDETRLIQQIATERQELEQNLEREKVSIRSVLDRKRQAFDEYRVYYLEQKQKQEKLQRDLVALAEEVNLFSQNFEKWSGDLQSLAVEADTLELKRKRLERDIEVYQETFNRFARLQEEARIAREQAAGDIQVVSRATIPRPMLRSTAKKVAIGGMVAVVVFSFLAFLLEYIKKSRIMKGTA